MESTVWYVAARWTLRIRLTVLAQAKLCNDWVEEMSAWQPLYRVFSGLHRKLESMAFTSNCIVI